MGTFENILITLVCALITAIMVGVVVIPYPTDITSYLALSFAIVLDIIWLYFIIPFPVRKHPKTVSKPLVLWLLVVLYCGLLASGFLTNAYLLTFNILVLVFDCIFSLIALAALVILIEMLIEHLIMQHCLKHGTPTTAEFISVGKMSTFEYGKPQTKSYHAIFRYSVNFKYTVNGQERTAKSKRVFSEQEVKRLQTMQTFNIKYQRNTAVINEILDDNQDHTKLPN